MSAAEQWYRFESTVVSDGVDQFDNPVGPGSTQLRLYHYPVVGKTPKGVWLDIYGRRRLVLMEARKRYACPTIHEAAESFRKRKARQTWILKRQIHHVEEALLLLDSGNYL